MESSGSRRSSAAVSADAPGDAGAAHLGDLGPQRLGLADQGAQPGPAFEHIVDFSHECPGPGEVAEGEVDAGQLDPGLDGKVRERGGQHRAHLLSCDEFPPRRLDVSAVQGYTG